MQQKGAVEKRVAAADLDHGSPKELVTQLKTLSELGKHCAVWNIVVGLLHDGVVKSGVKWVTHSRGSLHP